MSVTSNILNGQAYRFAITATADGKESIKIFSDLVMPEQILNKPIILSFTGDIVNTSNTSEPTQNISITEGQSITLAAVFKDGTGSLKYSINNKSIVTPAGIANTGEEQFSITLLPKVTTTYSFEVTSPNEPSVLQSVTVSVLKIGKIAFKFIKSDVSETKGTAVLTVIRSSANGKATIDYRTTAGGTAIGGTDINSNIDFIKTSGQLTFLDGVLSLDILVKLKNDNISNTLAPKHFIVELLAGHLKRIPPLQSPSRMTKVNLI